MQEENIKNKKVTWGCIKFCGGGCAYGLLEILWQGYTHFSMLILGGICFLVLYQISKTTGSLFLKCVIGGAFITAAEFVSGCFLNLWLGLSVWDYSEEAGHLLGQVCLKYALLWFFLCAILMPLFQWVRRSSWRLQSQQTKLLPPAV